MENSSTNNTPDNTNLISSQEKRNQWWESIERNFRQFCRDCDFRVHIDDNYGILWGNNNEINQIESSFMSKLPEGFWRKGIFKERSINTTLGYPAYPQGCLKDKTTILQDLLKTSYMPEYICDSVEPNKFAAKITVEADKNGDPRYQTTYNKLGWEHKVLDYPKKDVSPLYQTRAITYSTDGYQEVESSLPSFHELFFENNIVRPLKARDGTDIHYHMYVPKEFYLTSKPLPIIFMVYGGGIELEYDTEFVLGFKRILANFGCIVIVLKGEKMPRDESAGSPSTRINYTNFPGKLFEDIEDVYNILAKSKKDGGLWETP